MSIPTPQPPEAAGKDQQRVPRRVVLLAGDEKSEVAEVLQEFSGGEPRERSLHAEIERLAARHKGRCLAGEWLGPLGWTRFLWCRKGG